ncbi:MAG: flagellin [Phycisphaeraceae bacterium]|nr:MAG: flagellin [Phycisphaeraceae bacterium]
MSRINTNIQSLIAQRVLGSNNTQLSQSLERLATGTKISRGKDDPAGLIASEALSSEIRSTNAAIANADRADQVVNIAEGGLQEVSSLLTELQGLITSTASRAGLSDEEKQANQLQVDSILQTIDRIASATSFQGIKLLNGNFDFRVSGLASGVADYRINGAKFGGSSLNINAIVTQSAQQGGLFMSFGGANLDLSSQNASFTVEVRGSLGARELTFSSGTTMSSIAAAINTFKDVTGVEARSSGTGVKLYSSNYGSSAFTSVKVVNDGGAAGNGVYRLADTNFNASQTTGNTAFTAATNGVQDFGQDIKATINGIQATTSGRTARINTDFLDVELTLGTSTSQTLGAVGSGGVTATVTGGGADFQLAGKVDIAGKVSMGIGDVAVRKLGSSNSGFLSTLANGNTNNVVNGNLTNAQKVVSEAITQVSSLRGRLGAFQKNTIGATIRSLNVSVENSTAAQSVIRDSDFASETAALTRSQILVAASTNVLGLANQTPQSVLQLLG